ncbi:MAG: F0F1 ATP synthase subunit gamma [Deltaproteobacteria bacterium]|nr:F0F1 ATP synthase subunit gamma [Deltaproteobacteria bacterium]
MPTLEDIKGKIKTAQDLHSLVKTMKALAAVSIRQYEQAVKALRDYFHTVELGFQVIIQNQPRDMPLVIKPGPSPYLGAVVFGSDQGMCGQLNEQIFTHTIETLDGLGYDRQHRKILAVGLRLADRLSGAGEVVDHYVPVPASAEGIGSQVRKILSELERWGAHKIHRVILIYSRHLGGASYLPHTQHFLPVEEWWLETFKEKKWPTRVLPTFTMPWERLLPALIHQHLFVSLYRAFAESLASEHASRLASMQGAERNIEERLAELTALFNRQRQMSITEELLDIVAGFTALTEQQQ